MVGSLYLAKVATGLFAFALACAIVERIADGQFGNVLNGGMGAVTDFAGDVLGAAVIFAISGIVPLLIWASYRFRVSRLTVPTLIWAISIVLFIHFLHTRIATRISSTPNQQTERIQSPPSSQFSGPAAQQRGEAQRHGYVEITGEIDDSSVNHFKQFIEGANKQYAGVSLKYSDVVLNSPGGSVNAAMAIGRMLRSERLVAQVNYGNICYSSCVLILAGAVARYTGGPIGIHRPYFEASQRELPPEKLKELYQKMLQNIRSYLREMNVSEQLADAMLRIDPSAIRVLSEAALNGFGLTRKDPIEQETFELEEAQRYGINRQEYARRRHIVETICQNGKFDVDMTDDECYEMVMKTGRTPVYQELQQENLSKYLDPGDGTYNPMKHY
jgi:hypothetical protein